MQLTFDAAVIPPSGSKTIEGQIFGLLTVKQHSNQVQVSNHIKITLWECVCNCRGFAIYDGELTGEPMGKKVTSHHHLVQGNTWCCDACKAYYKTPQGKAVLADANFRMKHLNKQLAEALMDAECYFIHCQIESGTY